MVLTCIFLNGEKKSDDSKNLSISEIGKIVENGMIDLQKVSITKLLGFLNYYSRMLIQSEKTKNIDGIAFLSNWLRKSNLEKLIQNNLGNKEILNQYVGTGNKRVKARPKGIVCHWIAGNVPTLAIFSLFQSLLVRNANVVRLPQKSVEVIAELLNLFSEITFEGIYGKDLLKSIAILTFPSTDEKINNDMSILADVRIVWGGSVAVKSIQGLDHREHCEDVIFGPKYSFSVIDNEVINSENLEKYIRRFSNDVVAFEQSACSSPHVFFVESADQEKFDKIIELFKRELERLKTILPKETISQVTSTQIINKRSEYALSEDKKVYCSKENDWTILVDKNLMLEEPIQSRTIWIKPVNNLLDVINIITRKIQTIGCAIANEEKFYEFVDLASFKGVARCVAPGQMNIYDSPWDGVYLLQRLVNWVTAVKI
jgi:hypothetical protein